MPHPLSSVKSVIIGSDHAGFAFKEKLKAHLQSLNLKIVDVGPTSEASVDYPDFASQVCRKVSPSGFIEVGILICGSGQGMAITANKFPHIRAALCWSKEIAQLARGHNDANVLCIGARMLDHSLCLEICDIFLSTPFEGGRHQTRVDKISQAVGKS